MLGKMAGRTAGSQRGGGRGIAQGRKGERILTTNSDGRRRVWTDGACQGNPGPGGWAWAAHGGPFASGAAPQTTNQRMELTAALEAITALDGDLEIVSDSTYVVNCFKNRWWQGWERRNWRNAKGEPVANQDLWRPLVEAALRRSVAFSWVKGHSGDPMNDLVDRLAVQAAATQAPCAGLKLPTPS